MTLPVSGAISFNAINVELGVSGTTQASLGQSSYRTLAGVPSGQISMSNFYGKSNTFSFTISTNQTNANLRTLAINAGWNQSSNVVATISAGVYVSSNSTGTPALTVSGSFPGGVSLVNNGLIIGMGGAGGVGNGWPGNVPTLGAAGGSGGLALSVSSAISITNNGTIGGGGGGGGGGGLSFGATKFGSVNPGGGGGGGGQSSAAANSSGGAGGVGVSATSGTAGGAGTVSAAGGGGARGTSTGVVRVGGNGGAGGGWGSSGSNGANGQQDSTTYNAYYPGRPAGAAGGAVSGNSNITWVAFGTRLGGIS